MKQNMNKLVYEEAHKRYEAILLAGAFPDVQFKKGPFVEYSLMEYTEHWSQMTHLLHEKLINAGYPDGIRSNKRDEAFAAQVRMICDNITAEDTAAHAKRFRTWMD